MSRKTASLGSDEKMALVAALACVLLAYAAVDRVLRRGALAALSRSPWAAVVLLSVAPFWSWDVVSQRIELDWVACAVATFLSWNASTRDLDPVNPGPGGWTRAFLLSVALSSFSSPALLLVSAGLLSGRFHFWQHHAAFPMRVLQSFVAFALLCTLVGALCGAGFDWLDPTALEAALVLFLTIMIVSHYVITALAKGLLGPKPWSWLVHNRLHYLPASAYSWGWARFIPWRRFRCIVALVERVERPLQIVVFLLELTVPLALLDPDIAVFYCVAFAGFHVGVCLLSGLFFWDWMLTDLLLALLIVWLPRSVADEAFGVVPFAMGSLTLGLFPLRHRLWKPMPLGWYDSPFTQRVHWRVTGVSGKTYGLYNDFMCPHERLYGKVHGSFAVPHAVLTYHLGELWKLELRDALVEAGPDLTRLDHVRERFGIHPACARLTARHQQYLTAFFAALNRGEKKSLLPRWARCLKAPGDQLFYWGDLEPYRRQEPVTRVVMIYREEFFDGRDLVRLVDQELLGFDIVDTPPDVALEMTPREMDDYLLSLAWGRLIDVPGFRGDYLAGDDQVGKLARA